jgi:CDP-diacylglycerol--serine O-phosphatidyltransferase
MIKKHIPNALTCLNLAFGFWGILLIINGEAAAASYCILASLVVDFLDGFAARLLHVSSPIGKELDSLADVVSFGILPSIMLTYMIGANTAQIPYDQIASFNLFKSPVFSFLLFAGTFPAMFSALRLAKFNLDTRQNDSFFGVPTPTNALIVASFNLIALDSKSFLYPFIQNNIFIISYCIIMSYLLISELPLIALKFKNFGWKENKYRFLLAFTSLVILLILGKESVPFIILTYIVFSMLQNRSERIYH